MSCGFTVIMTQIVSWPRLSRMGTRAELGGHRSVPVIRANSASPGMLPWLDAIGGLALAP